jgi:hypothetical protein
MIHTIQELSGQTLSFNLRPMTLEREGNGAEVCLIGWEQLNGVMRTQIIFCREQRCLFMAQGESALVAGRRVGCLR